MYQKRLHRGVSISASLEERMRFTTQRKEGKDISDFADSMSHDPEVEPHQCGEEGTVSGVVW